MASEADRSSILSGAGTRSTAAGVIARQDRIPIWSLSYLFIGIIGIGFLFTFYDIFDITVSFILALTRFRGVLSRLSFWRGLILERV